MSQNCPYCGKTFEVGMTEGQCSNEKHIAQTTNEHMSQQIYPNMNAQQQISPIHPVRPFKSKIAAGVLGIFFGGFGVHKFYLGKVGQGILYLCFCWTFIPAIIGFIEGIIYLCSDDYNFELKHRVKVK